MPEKSGLITLAERKRLLVQQADAQRTLLVTERRRLQDRLATAREHPGGITMAGRYMQTAGMAAPADTGPAGESEFRGESRETAKQTKPRRAA